MAIYIFAIGCLGLFGYKCAYQYAQDQIITKAQSKGFDAEIGAIRFKLDGLQIVGMKLKSYSDPDVIININKINTDYELKFVKIYGVDVHAKNLDDLLDQQKSELKNKSEIPYEREFKLNDVSILTSDFSTTGTHIVISSHTFSILMPSGFVYKNNGRQIETKGVEILPRSHVLKAREIHITKTETPIKQITSQTIDPIRKMRGIIDMIPEFEMIYEFNSGSIQEKFIDVAFVNASGKMHKSGSTLIANLEADGLSQGSLLSLEKPKIELTLNPNKRDDGSFVLSVQGDSATTKNEAIVNDTIKSKEFKIELMGHAYNMFQISVTGKLSIGAISVSGQIDTAPYLNWSLETPELQCNDVIEYLPGSVISQLGEAKYEGTIEITLNGEIKDEEPGVSLKVKNECKVVNLPLNFSVNKFKHKFDHTVYDANGNLKTIELGPGSSDWTSIDDIPERMILAVMNSEDPGFYGHRGISYSALQNAMEDNIRSGSFLRGASTISMQLAKNLWLMREKTIARKIQEAFLVIYLEQELTKKQIMELYLNVIEYGPNVYGIKNAARYYFQTQPNNLSLAQCVFLASILPSPKTGYFNTDGTLGERRTHYIHKLMHIMEERGMITNDELENGLKEQLVFGKSNIKLSIVKIAENGMLPSEWN